MYIDDNECDDAAINNCTELQSCINTPGSFSCSCLPGYRPSLTSLLQCEGEKLCIKSICNSSQKILFKGIGNLAWHFSGLLNYHICIPIGFIFFITCG